MRSLFLMLSVAAVAGVCCPVAAQEAEADPPLTERGAGDHEGQRWTVSLGPGVIVAPRYPGSDGFRVLPIPALEVRNESGLFLSGQGGLGFEVIRTASIAAGPIVRPDFGRRQSDIDEFVPGLGSVGFAPELGGFAEYRFGGGVSARLEARQALGGHEGFRAEAGLRYSGRSGSFIYAFGPNLSFSDRSYMQSYFGVSPTESAASGLPEFQPSAGIESLGLSGFTSYPLTDGIQLSAFAGYDRLLGDAADSPVSAGPNGSADQFSFGLALSFRLAGGRRNGPPE